MQNITGNNFGDDIQFDQGGSLSGVITGGTGTTFIHKNFTSETLNLGSVITSGDLTIQTVGSALAFKTDATISSKGDLSISSVFVSSQAGGVVEVGSNDTLSSDSGDLTIQADNAISVGPDATISSRQTGDADLVSGDSTGDSGDISFQAPSITLGQGDLVLAQVEEGSPFEPGDVTLEAEDSSLRQATVLSPVNADTLSASISVTGATIRGADVELTTNAAVEEAYEDWGDYGDVFGEDLFNLLNQIPGMAIGALTGVSGEVIVRQSDASIDLDSSTIAASGDVTVASTATVSSSFHTVTLSGTLTNLNPFSISLGYGEAHSTATTTLSGTTIESDGAANITSSATTEDVAKSRTTANLLGFQGAPNPNTVALALAVANTSETSHVSISSDSSVTSTHGGIDADATGDVTNFSWAQPTVYLAGLGAFAVAVDYDKADIKTEVDGTLDAAGASNTFNADPAEGAVGVDYTDNTIRIPNNGFTDGEAVTYSNGGGPDIGGLEDGQTYYVQVVDGNTIRLANAPTLNLSYNTPTQYTTEGVQPTQTLGEVTKLDFDSSDVDTSTGTITFSSPHGLTDGEAVTYFGTDSSDDDSGAETNSGVAPLVVGQTYYVKWISDTTIQLSETPGGPAIALTDAGEGTHSLLVETDVMSFNPETAVNNASNTITFTSPTGFQTGDAVVYHTDPNASLSGQIDGMNLTAQDPAIGELEDGNVYYVVVINANTIRLTSSKEAAMEAAPIDLTPGVDAGSGLGSEHSLSVGVDGINIHAGLEAVNNVTASTTLSSDDFSGAAFLSEGAVNADTLIGGLTLLPEALVGNIIKLDPLSAGLPALSAGFAGAIGVNYFDHDVDAVVESTAHILSSRSIKVAADIDEASQLFVTSNLSRDPGTDLAISAAIGIGLYTNTAKATVADGAHLDANDEVAVESEVDYPFNLSNPLDSINPVAYLKTSGPEGWAFFNDGTLGYASNLFNTYVMSQSSARGRPRSAAPSH